MNAMIPCVGLKVYGGQWGKQFNLTSSRTKPKQLSSFQTSETTPDSIPIHLNVDSFHTMWTVKTIWMWITLIRNERLSDG